MKFAVCVFVLAAVPSIYGADVCTDDLSVSYNDAVSASSVFAPNDKTANHGPERVHLNTTETKDASGVTQMGAWVAEKKDFNQWVEVQLKDVSLIRGVITQGRNGCCKEWVKKYRVLYSEDCKTWHTVPGFNVTDAFFKANSDQDTPVTNMFACPAMAKCIRINPLGWYGNIAMRMGLVGCKIDTNGASKSSQTSTPLLTAITSTAAPVTTQRPLTTTQQPAITSQKPTQKSGNGPISGSPQGCIKSCKGMANGDYQSCSGCDMFTTCVWSSMYDKRPCPKNLKWDNKLKRCDMKSTTCP